MYWDKAKLYIQKDDQCSTCVHGLGDVHCPFLQGLFGGFTILASDITVKKCRLYTKRERPLKAIKGGRSGRKEA